VTVEGAATAKAVSDIAVRDGIDMPITRMIAALVAQKVTLPEAIQALLSRPLKQE
jgi:glycerol-3-phosphate dehydrogenase (NAD(P)+)